MPSVVEPMKTMLARWVSIVAHPFVLIAVMVVSSTMHLRGWRDALPNLAVVAGFVIVPLFVLMILQVRRGRWGNVDASNKRERPVLYAVGIAAVALLLVYLWIRGAAPFLVRGAVVVLVLLLVCATATRWIKLSLHVAAAALAATALILLGSLVGWIIAVAVPVLIWSRLTLGRHTPAEVAVGLAFGAAAGVAMHLF
jgi:membrane-associated phospholipid phosphatase